MLGCLAALLRQGGHAATACGDLGLLRGTAASQMLEQSGRQLLRRGMSSVAAPTNPDLIRNFAIIGAPLRLSATYRTNVAARTRRRGGWRWAAAAATAAAAPPSAALHTGPPLMSVPLWPGLPAAHVDHGKTTLMDRLLTFCGATLRCVLSARRRRRPHTHHSHLPPPPPPPPAARAPQSHTQSLPHPTLSPSLQRGPGDGQQPV